MTKPVEPEPSPEDLRRSQAELRDSNALIEAVVENVPLMIFLKEARDLRFVIFNRAGEELLGYDRKELLGKNNLDLFPPDQAAHFMTQDRAVLDGEAGFLDIPEEPILTARKGQRLLHTRKVCIRGSDGATKFLLGISEDITERKQAETALLHAHDLMRYIIEHSRSAVAVHDRDLKYIYVSQRYLDDYQVSEKDIIGKHHYDVFPDLPQKWRDVHQKALAGEISSAEDDPYVRADGTVVWTRWECRPWYEADSAIGGIIVYTEVITARKQVEAALLESEKRFRDLVSQSPLSIQILDVSGKTIQVNRAFEKLWGVPLAKMGTYNLLADDQFDELGIRPYLQRVFSGEPVEFPLVEFTPKTEFGVGRKCVVQVLGYPIKDNAGTIQAVIMIHQDITERKQAEEQMARQLDELRRWQAVTLGREGRIAELKLEVNALAARLGLPPPYGAPEDPARQETP